MSSSSLVVLRGGVSVPAPAYCLLLDLEGRGVTVARTDDGMLSVGPSDRLTDADRHAIRLWKPTIIRLLDYCRRADLDAHLLHSDLPREAAHA